MNIRLPRIWMGCLLSAMVGTALIVACSEDLTVPAIGDASQVEAGEDGPTLIDDGGVDVVNTNGIVAATDPGSATFPKDIRTLTVGIKTDQADASATDRAYEVCFAANATDAPSNCKLLDLKDVNDFRPGGFDRHHFEGVNLSRDVVKYMVLRPVSNPSTDPLRIQCLDVRFDGEPVSCMTNLNQEIGGGAAEFRVPVTNAVSAANACVSSSCEGANLVHGPKWGPMDDAARLRMWVRTDATRKVAMLLSDRPDGTNAVPVAWALPTPENDFTATLLSTALPDRFRAYHYAVSVDGKRTGPFQPVPTTPRVVSKVRIGMGSCARDAIQPVYDAMAQNQFNLFLYLGDNMYGNSNKIDRHRYEYRRLDDMANRAAFLAKVPLVATWDDHDYVQNNSDGLCVGRESALRGFSEAWPTLALGTPAAPGTYSKASMGPVDVVMLDCRSYRPRVADPGRDCDVDAGVPAGQDVSAGPLGETQYQWMMTQLSQSKAPFKIVTCGSLFTYSGVDSWGSFSAARDRFFAELGARKIQGVVLASGDIHRSQFRRYDRGGGLYPMTELVASPLALSIDVSCEMGDPRVLQCYGEDSYISMEVDGTIADPTLVARIHSENGAVQHQMTLKRSMLQ